MHAAGVIVIRGQGRKPEGGDRNMINDRANGGEAVAKGVIVGRAVRSDRCHVMRTACREGAQEEPWDVGDGGSKRVDVGG